MSGVGQLIKVDHINPIDVKGTCFHLNLQYLKILIGIENALLARHKGKMHSQNQ